MHKPGKAIRQHIKYRKGYGSKSEHQKAHKKIRNSLHELEAFGAVDTLMFIRLFEPCLFGTLRFIVVSGQVVSGQKLFIRLVRLFEALFICLLKLMI
jgi:hypothetical protein